MAKAKIENTEYTSDPRLESAIAAATAEIGSSIGRLSEKLLHRTLKHYLEPDTTAHEIECLGSVADIMRDGRITEIQTRSLSRLAPKLSRFLESYPVTVVYPVVTDRLVEWCDPESGEIVEVKKSPKKGRECDLLAELAGLSDLVGREGLRFMIIRVSVREVRLLDGYGKDFRRHATKLNILPLSVAEPHTVSTLREIASLLPDSLADSFTSAELFRALRLKGIRASLTLRMLLRLGIIEKTGTEGRAYLYKRTQIPE